MIASSAPLAPISYGVRGTLSGSGQYGSVGVSPSAKWGVSLAQALRRPLRPTCQVRPPYQMQLPCPSHRPPPALIILACPADLVLAAPCCPAEFSTYYPTLKRLWASDGTRAADDREVTVLAGGTGPLGSRRHPTRLGVRTASVTEGTRRRTGCGVDSRRRMAGLMSSRAGISKPLATRVMV